MIKIPLRDGSEYELDEVECKMLCDGYPRVDVMNELQKMSQWCRANPQRRKTLRGIRRFINGWLLRSPEKKDRKVAYAAAHRFFELDKPKTITKERGIKGIRACREAMKR